MRSNLVVLPPEPKPATVTIKEERTRNNEESTTQVGPNESSERGQVRLPNANGRLYSEVRVELSCPRSASVVWFSR